MGTDFIDKLKEIWAARDESGCDEKFEALLGEHEQRCKALRPPPSENSARPAVRKGPSFVALSGEAFEKSDINPKEHLLLHKKREIALRSANRLPRTEIVTVIANASPTSTDEGKAKFLAELEGSEEEKQAEITRWEEKSDKGLDFEALAGLLARNRAMKEKNIYFPGIANWIEKWVTDDADLKSALELLDNGMAPETISKHVKRNEHLKVVRKLQKLHYFTEMDMTENGALDLLAAARADMKFSDLSEFFKRGVDIYGAAECLNEGLRKDEIIALAEQKANLYYEAEASRGD